MLCNSCGHAEVFHGPHGCYAGRTAEFPCGCKVFVPPGDADQYAKPAGNQASVNVKMAEEAAARIKAGQERKFALKEMRITFETHMLQPLLEQFAAAYGIPPDQVSPDKVKWDWNEGANLRPRRPMSFHALSASFLSAASKPPSIERRWVLDHEDKNPRRWHYYPDDANPALCGYPQIPGMPIVGHVPSVTIAPTCVCRECFELTENEVI